MEYCRLFTFRRNSIQFPRSCSLSVFDAASYGRCGTDDCSDHRLNPEDIYVFWIAYALMNEGIRNIAVLLENLVKHKTQNIENQ